VPFPTFAGIFLLSASVLCTELLQMRLLSYMLWHHLAYMVISMALLGLSAGGVMLAVFHKRILAKWQFWLPLFTALSGLLTILTFSLLTRLSLDTFTLDLSNLLFLLLYYALLAIPFAVAGLSLSIAFTVGIHSIGKLYFSDLLGAATGAMLYFVIIEPLGAPRALTVASFLAGAAGICFALNDPMKFAKARALALAMVLLAFIPLAEGLIVPEPAYTKAISWLRRLDPTARIVFTKWTPISRIDCMVSSKPSNPWLAGKANGEDLRMITIDGDASTWMTRRPDASGELPRPPAGQMRTFHLAFLLLNKPEVLIIGAGGSDEIFTAIQMDATSVAGVELSSATLSLSTSVFPEFVGNVYLNPRAKAIWGEGRGFIRRSDRKFDLIQMTGVDTWAGLSSGAYVLSENYLYTVDAFSDFLSHLKPGGIFSVERWALFPPRESLRMVSLACEALSKTGVQDSAKHIVVLNTAAAPFVRVLVKNEPFTPEQVGILKKAVEGMGGRVLAPAGAPSVNAYEAVIQSYRSGDQGAFFRDYPFDVKPVYDDSPFFFEYYKWSRLFDDMWSKEPRSYTGANKPVALTVLSALLIQACVLSLLLLILPLRLRQVAIPREVVLPAGAYFAGIGAAFMFVEIGFMQRFVLFLGHPAFSIPAVLCSMLLFAGLGSYLFSLLQARLGDRLRFAILLIPAVILLISFIIPYVFDLFLGKSFTARIIVSAILVGLPATIMGVAFPLGLSTIRRVSEVAVPWAWAVNGASSVVGSVAVIIVAMGLGFSSAMVIASLMYLSTFFAFSGFANRSAV